MSKHCSTEARGPGPSPSYMEPHKFATSPPPYHKTPNRSPEMTPVPQRVRGLPAWTQNPHPIPKSDNLEIGKILEG